MDDNSIRINGLTAEEWEGISNPAPATDEQLQNLGFIEPPKEQPQDNQEQNKLYETADKLGIEHPNSDKEYQQLSIGGTLKDAAVSLGVEASHLFAPKSKELQYESKTHVGETLKYGYRYLAGTASLFVGGGLVGGAIRGVGIANKATKAVKIGEGIQKLFAGTDIIKTGAKASKLSQIGARMANAAMGGAFSGAIADYNLYRPEEQEGHLADVFGNTSNEFVKWMQSDINDSEAEARFKNVVEGLIMGTVVGNVLEFGAKPLIGRLCKNIKTAVNAKTAEEAAQAIQEVAKDEIKLDKLTNKADMLEKVKEIKADAEASGEEASQMILDKLNVHDTKEAQEMLKVLEGGDEIFLHEDGTWAIRVEKWDDAYKVSPEEYNKQLLARDKAKADNMFNTEAVYKGDTALEHQNEAVKHTWTNRGWIGENEELTAKSANKIGKQYKDKWQIDNNIKIEFVDGLTIKGQAVEGNTQATKYLGKASKSKINAIDKKKLQIEKLEDKLKALTEENYKPDVEKQLQEEIRIAKNELKDLEKEAKNKNRISDITIQIDKNAKNPYATLRAELEHARDIAKGEVPNQSEKHFSRYNGLNEGEVASEYVYKKAQGKNQALQNVMNGGNDVENGVKYKQGDFINDTRKSNTISESDRLAADRSSNRTSIEGLSQSYERRSYNGNKGWLVETTHSLPDDIKAELKAQDIDAPDFHQLQSGNDEMAGVFYNALKKAKDLDPKGMASVDLHKPEEYKNMKMFLSENEDCGFVIKPDGDLISVFSYPKGSGRNKALMPLAIAQGAKKLDCYDTYLPKLYENFGFKEVKRDKWNEKFIPKNEKGEVVWDKKYFKQYNNGEPDVVYMELKNDTPPVKPEIEPQIEPEQLKLNFDNAINETATPEEAVNKMINGEIKAETEADIETLINKTIENDPEISGHTWKDVAEDAEGLAKKVEELGETDISAYKEAFFKGDTATLDELSRKELAASRVLSILADKLEELGLDAPIQAQRNICDMVVHISNYVDGIRSGAGRLLNEQKLVNRALDTFGSMRLSQLTKQGIQEFSDLLEKDIKELFNLNFTKGEQLNFQQMKQEIFSRVAKYGDGEFLEMLSTDAEFAKDFSEMLDNILKKQGNTDVNEIYKQIENIITSRQYKDAYEAALLAPKTEGKVNVIKNWTASQGGVASYYVHNLLSGLGTLAKNVGSGFLNTAYFPAKKILGGYLGGGEAMSKEGWNTYKALLSNWNESWQMMKEAFIKGEGKLTDVGVDTLNMDDDVFRGFHDLNDDNLWHKIQNLHSIMTRAMGATDEFMSQLNYRSICRARCLEQADKMAELAGKANDEEWINELADKFFKKKFDAEGKPLDVEAFNEAKSILYQNKLDGTQFDVKKGKDVQMREPTAVMKIASSINAAANKNTFLKVIFPFVKTGANILQMNLDHNALYAAFSPVQRKLLLSKTPEGALARSQVAFGTFSLAMGTMMAANGMITGSAPTDPKERKALFETGWKPYSVKVGDTYISYQGYEPIHTMLGFAADCFNVGQALSSPEDEQKWTKFAQQVGATLINNFIDKAAFRTGLKQMAVLTDPDKTVDWQKSMTQTAQGFLPDASFIKSMSSIGKREATQPNSWYEMLFNNYFNRGLGDYRRDVFGDRQDIYGLLVTTAGVQGNEPEYQELARLAEYGYNPSEISNIISETKLKFKNFKDPETGRSAYDAMQEELSTITIGGKTLREAIRELVSSPEYQILPDGIDNEIKWSSQDETKVNALNDIFRDYNDVAKENVINNNPQFVDRKGMTMEEAKEALEVKKMDKILNQNLENSAEKIRSIF